MHLKLICKYTNFYLYYRVMYNKKLQKLVYRAVKSKNKVYFANFSFTYYIYIVLLPYVMKT